MPSLETVTFQDALAIVESLPEQQQEELIAIIHRRRVEQRREALTERIQEARAEYARGEVIRGTVDDLLRELVE
jgi:hypothetical protein